MIDQQAIDDSIGYMTEMRSLCSVPDGNVAKAYDTALACLRECAERREGCEYCETPGKTLHVVECAEPRRLGSVIGS